MEKEVILTRDGSNSIAIPSMNVTYHSIHGAIQESRHVFIEAGLHAAIKTFPGQTINILEVGMGTGLNALLTLIESGKAGLDIDYTALEPHPLNENEAKTLNYTDQLNVPLLENAFIDLHTSEWEERQTLGTRFYFKKFRTYLQDLSLPDACFHLIYFDAFAPSAQPELWTTEVFGKLVSMMSPNGMLVTYCSKSDVRRAMKAAGLMVEKIPGPRGKREMVRAHKA